jgi:hypothetical protein
MATAKGAFRALDFGKVDSESEPEQGPASGIYFGVGH